MPSTAKVSEALATPCVSRAAAADHAAMAALASLLADARDRGERRPAFAVIGDALDELTGGGAGTAPPAAVVARSRDDWLARLRSAGRSRSAQVAYRVAIDDLLAWAHARGSSDALFEERTIVTYLEDYRRRCAPAPATYHRRFLVLRRFMRWVAQREGVRDPFCDLDAPPKPRQVAAWLTPEEFARLLDAAGRPGRRVGCIVERDRLVLRALVTTGLRRSELVAVNWGDVDLGEPASLLVRCGKGGKPRRQPVPHTLAVELRALAERRQPAPGDPVFTGLRGGRLQPAILAAIIRRAATRAQLDKPVTAHTLRHTAATWLRQATGDARLVAEYLGHADLSTVSRYAHVADDELRQAAEAIAARAATPAPEARALTG